MKNLTFVEIDIEVCSRTYGVSPCIATLTGEAPTGTRKCFNTRATCQDRANYAASTVTLRFAEDAGYLAESGIDAIPCIAANGVSLKSAIVSLGENLGERGSVTVSFGDFPWPDTGPGYDPYLADRPYDPFKTGTYWGKFRARQPYLRLRPLRIIRGVLGQTLAEMETRHFLVDSFEGPSLDGRFTITGKDALKMADEDRAQAPRPSNGYLTANITSSATTATLGPAGVGDAEYPTSGIIAIAGKEICTFTRSGNTLTLTRAQYGTAAVSHEAQDRVQVCLEYSGETPAFIIADLFEDYADMPSEFIPIADWEFECSTYLRRVYSGLIAEPTGVDKLASAMIQQAGLAVWWDEVARIVRLQVLRQIPADAEVIDDSVMIAESLKVREQPDKRVSQVWTYFGIANPLKKADDADNYRSAALTIDAQAQDDYGSAAIKTIYARWIPPFGRQVALRVNDIQLGRFRDAPRKFTFPTFRGAGPAPLLGRGYRVASRVLQADTGEADSIPVQVISLRATDSGYDVTAEEMRFVSFDEGDLDNRVIIIDANTFNFNFRTAHDQLYPDAVSGDTVTCIIEAGVIVGSNSTALPAFTVGTWASGVDLILILRGRIQGAGGQGGNYANPFGKPGGPALYSRYAIDLQAEGDGAVWGGGGGGAAWFSDGVSGGGGGQGYVGGPGGVGFEPGGTGTAGTSETRGLGFGGAGRGGGPGAAGGHAGRRPHHHAAAGAAARDHSGQRGGHRRLCRLGLSFRPRWWGVAGGWRRPARRDGAGLDDDACGRGAGDHLSHRRRGEQRDPDVGAVDAAGPGRRVRHSPGPRPRCLAGARLDTDRRRHGL